MRVSFSPLTPKEIERESRVRIHTTIGPKDDVDLDSEPRWGFTGWGARPAVWLVGEWDGRTANSSLIGQQPDLAPGIHQVWIEVTDGDGEYLVKHLGQVTVR